MSSPSSAALEDYDPTWEDDPIVKRVIRKHSDLDPLKILTELSSTLNDLEEKFPGVPFSAIYAMANGDTNVLKDEVTQAHIAKKAGVARSTVTTAFTNPEVLAEGTRDRVLEVARELGYGQHRQADLAGGIEPSEAKSLRRHMANCGVPAQAVDMIVPYVSPGQRMGNYPKVAALVSSGKSIKELRAAGYPRNFAFMIGRIRKPFRDIEREVGEAVLDNPNRRMIEIAEEFEVSDSMASEYALKVRYWREQGTEPVEGDPVTPFTGKVRQAAARVLPLAGMAAASEFALAACEARPR